MIKENKFPIIILFLTCVSFLLVYLFFSYSIINQSSEKLIKPILFFSFSCITFIFGWFELKKNIVLESRFQLLKKLVVISLSILLVSSILHSKISSFTSGIFVVCSLIYLLRSKLFYQLNKVYYFVFLYALMLFFGTIGIPDGFHFPDRTYSFYLFPLAFCCFRLEKEVCLSILRFFFRAMLIYMAFALVYWFFNMQYIDVKYTEWITSKISYNGLFGYLYVTSWSYYTHPSYVSFVLFLSLITGFYLYFKKSEKLKITKIELIIFFFFFLLNELAMQSRIGIVCMLFIIIVTGFYYIKLKTRYFKLAILFCFILGYIGFITLDNTIDAFFTDDVRRTENTLAINYIKDHFWWGAGYHQETQALEEQQEIMKDILPISPYPKTYTHNQLLGDMLQYGIWGGILLILLMVVLFRYSIISKSYLLQMLLSVTILFMLIEEPLYVQEGITRFLIFLTFFIHISESEKSIKSYSLFKRFSKS